MAQYAKQSNIELYTHNDEREIFPETRVQDMLAKALGPEWAGQRGGPDNNNEDNNNIVGVASGGGGSSTATPAAAAELGTGTGTGVVAVSDNEPWHCSWVARYSTVIKMRGIMSFKGYASARTVTMHGGTCLQEPSMIIYKNQDTEQKVVSKYTIYYVRVFIRNCWTTGCYEEPLPATVVRVSKECMHVCVCVCVCVCMCVCAW